MKKKNGFSIIEIIVAIGMMLILGGSAVITVLGSFSAGRLAVEEAQATSLMVEGLEVVQSIRNRDWGELVDGVYGLVQSEGEWVLGDGSDVNGKFTRRLTISSVERDGNGDLIESGGTTDLETKLVSVNVSWSFTPLRENSVTADQYLTRWSLARSQAGSGGGTVVTCADYCLSVGYATGTCRQNINQCNINGQTHQPVGDAYCTGGGSGTCCCGN